MKNLIRYYYDLLIDEFRKIDDYFIFDVGKIKYKFMIFDDDINRLYKIYSILNNSNNYCHQIILNKDNSFITFYENKPYILFKYNIDLRNKVTFEDILNYDFQVYDNRELNWKKLWESKIDYYEYQINQFGFKYPIIRDSLSYYIGISETAITLLNYINVKNIGSYISHKRINYNEDINEFLNPINIIIDNRTRDISEYFKVNYINENIQIYEIINTLEQIDLNYDESILLMARLLYPSYYFDMYDKIIQEKLSEEKINDCIKKNAYYEAFLKDIYKYLLVKYNIPEIEWLNN